MNRKTSRALLADLALLLSLAGAACAQETAVATPRAPSPAAPAQAAAPAQPARPDAPGELEGIPISRRIDAHLDFLASDDLGGRETGTVQSLITGQYVAATFRSAGLEPGAGDDYLQSYPMSSNRLLLDQATLALQAPGAPAPIGFRLFDDYLLRGFTSVGFDLSGELVLAGHGLVSASAGVDEYAGLDVQGRFAVVFDRGPEGREDLKEARHWRSKREAAKARGAIGLIVLTDLDEPATRMSLDELADQLRHPSMSIPAEEGGKAWPIVMLKTGAAEVLLKAAGLDLKAERKRYDTLPQPGKPLAGLRLDLHAAVDAVRTHAYNIAGIVRGSDPALRDEYVIVSAHNDHLGIMPDGRINNGADDNGTGTTTLLTVAEVLARGVPMKRSVLFLSVSGEEKGLLGSGWWCEHPTVPIPSCVADINVDMVGRNDPDAVGVTPSPELADYYNSLVPRAIELGPQAGLRITWTAPSDGDDRVDDYFTRSDHYNFAQQGIPVVFFFSGLHKDYHRPTDTLEKINRDKLQRMVRFVTLLARDVADAPDRPTRIKSDGG